MRLTDLAQWYYEVGRDGHSLLADPQFIDVDGPDGRRGYDLATSTDYGADDDFHVAFGSPAVNAGDPLSFYAAEPSTGNRVNLGAFGNTADATASLTQVIKLTEPGILSKFEVGQPIALNWTSAGFTSTQPLALLNAGGSAIYDMALGRWGADTYRTGGTNRTVTGTIDMSGVTNPPPASVLQSYADIFVGGTNGASMRYDIPLADGACDVRLFFVEPSGGNRRFDVRLQGQTVLDNYNIQADAGAVRKAIAKSFAVTAVGGQGLTVQLVNDGSAAGFDAIISGIEITRANPTAPTTFAANVEFSPDNGQTWSTIATNVPANRFGEGSFTWNVTTETNGNTGRFRLTALGDGVPSVQHVSEPFSVNNNGNAYYVNIAADSDLSDNEFTTASGDNLNTGKSPNSPMKSLDALIRAYDLDAGDTIYVDSGAYGRLLTNATFTAEDSGVTLQGPTQPGHAAVLTRGTSAIGSAVLEFTGGVTDVVADSLEMHAAENGVSIASGSSIEIRNSVIRNNSNRGIDVNSSATNVRILNNQIEENTSRGIETRGSQITIENNLIRNSDRGIKVNGTPSGNVVILDNDIFGHNVGVETSAINVVGNVIQGNTIHDNATHGIFATGGSAGGLQIVGNELYGHAGTSDVGIFYSVSGGFAMTISDNLVHHNYFGFDIPSVTGTVQRNQIYANSSAGIRQSGTSNVLKNQIYSNATGILLTGTSTTSTVRNNLIYNNTNVGIDVSNGNYLITDNTIVHPVGTAVRFTGNGTGRLKNNIVQADVGTLVSVATGGQAAFVSDYNLVYPTGAAANVGVWGSTIAPTLGDWQSTSGRDANSISADPLFLDTDGADNVLGEQGVPEGNGFDDNFGLQANSPAIDRGDTWSASAVDSLDRPRQDDAGTTNAGRLGTSKVHWEPTSLPPPAPPRTGEPTTRSLR